MLARRRAALGAARADGRVPAWLGGWVDYCVGLPAGGASLAAAGEGRHRRCALCSNCPVDR